MPAVTITWTDESISSEGQTNTLNTSANTLQFDAIERLARSSTAEVTQYAVESGATLTDHKRTTPRKIVIDGLVTNTPIGAPPPSGQRGISSRVSAEVRGSSVGNVLQFSEEFDRIQEVYDSLRHLVENPIFCSVETPEDVFERVTVTSVENVKTRAENVERFTVTFQEIFIGETEEAEVPIPLEPRGTSSRDESASSTQTTDEDLPQSWALGLGQGVGLFD